MLFSAPPPPGPRRFLWGLKIKFEGAFAIDMLETWEKGLVYSTLLFITLLFWLSVLTYTPNHLTYLSRRFAYYVFEDESVDLGAIVWEWIREWVRFGWKGTKGLITGVGGSAAMGKGPEL